ncbi:mannose-1-phosphate guanylyltransferase [Achromatium sp. WMS2]|nr:mannose-1-phosphate guanylyltransferase [Achromatium sp. WMS2]
MKAMILAAGRGERMRPLTDTIPKPLIKAGSKPLIQYHIEALVTAGYQDLVINHAYLGAQIEEALGDGSRFNANIVYSPEGTALGTGGGIFNALPLLGSDPFLVVNADVWSDINLGSINLVSGKLAHLVLIDNPEHNLAGDFVLQNDLVLNPGSGPTLTFSGISLYNPQLFADCQPGSFPLTKLLRKACDNGQVSGQHYRGQWLDVGTPERLKTLEQILATASP